MHLLGDQLPSANVVTGADRCNQVVTEIGLQYGGSIKRETQVRKATEVHQCVLKRTSKMFVSRDSPEFGMELAIAFDHVDRPILAAGHHSWSRHGCMRLGQPLRTQLRVFGRDQCGGLAFE